MALLRFLANSYGLHVGIQVAYPGVVYIPGCAPHSSGGTHCTNALYCAIKTVHLHYKFMTMAPDVTVKEIGKVFYYKPDGVYDCSNCH